MKRNFYYVTLFFMLCGFGLFAQKTPQKASLLSKAEYVRSVPALSKMDNIISSKGIIKQGREKGRGKNTYVPGKGFPVAGQADPLLQIQQKSSRVAISEEVANFQSFQGFSTPSDPTGAIGPNHYVYAFNSGFGVRDRDGNVLLEEASLSTIFPGENLGDPIVLYDNYAERFVITQFSNSPNGILMAVGQGPDPVNDGWFTYRFNTGEFPDYEKVSIWSDGYYITSNKAPNGSVGSLETVYVVERDLMLVGDPNAQFVGFTLPGGISSGFYSPASFNSTGSTLPPVGVGNSFIFLQDDGWAGVSNDHLKIWTTNISWTNPGSSTISQPVEIPTAPFDSVFDAGNFVNLPQPSGSDIDALQATMMYMTNYRRFGTHNSVVLNFVVDLDGNDDLAGIRWYELRQTSDGQAWSIFQEGTYAQPDGLSAFGGSIAQDGQGNIGLAYTVVSTSTFPSLRYTGRLVNDPVGTMTLIEQVGVNGTQSDPSTRYGDYSQMTVDPTDDMTFWYTGEYFDAGFRKNHVFAYRLAPEVVDEEAPTVPTNVASSNTTARETTLSWSASTDNIGVTGYDIFQDGVLVATVPGLTTVINGLAPETTYEFFVVAKDASGNVSPQSSAISVTTLESTTGPGCIDGLLAPYAESFESGLGAWTQDTSDDLNWVVDANGTPSNNTGPSSAIDGTSYIYVEASGNGTGFPDKSAILNSPCFDLNDSTAATFSFQFHMFGSDDFGSLTLEASNDGGVSWTNVWSRSGNQGDSWQNANVDLSSFLGSGVQLRFVRVTAGTWRADAAIDQVALTTNSDPTTGGGDCVTGDVNLSITLDNFPQETSWTLTNSSGSVVASESYSTNNPDGSTVTETFDDLSNDTYTFTISDAFGDGICCGFGNGSYTLSSDAGVIISGGEFDSSESTDFCIEGSTALQSFPLSGLRSQDTDTDAFKIHPVPTTGILNVIVGNRLIDNVKIFSMYGQLVKEITDQGTNSQIDVSNLAVGTYFVRFTSDKEELMITRKFLIGK